LLAADRFFEYKCLFGENENTPVVTKKVLCLNAHYME